MNNDKYFNPVSRSIKINVPTNKVWEIIFKPGVLELCHPFCKSNPVENWAGNKSIDYVIYYSGLKYQRIFTDWIDGVGYDLVIGRRNGKKSKVIWRISNTNGSSSELKITIFPYDISNYSKVLRTFIYLFYINPMLGKYVIGINVLQAFIVVAIFFQAIFPGRHHTQNKNPPLCKSSLYS